MAMQFWTPVVPASQHLHQMAGGGLQSYVKSYGKIDPINIKQNIVNQIYSKIIEQLKRDIEIEVDNEQLLKL